MSDTIYQFKVTLKEIQPPIWRRFQVRSDITFRAIADPKHEEHERYLEWIGGSFNPEAFDLDKVTQQFREGVYWRGELVAPPLTSTQTFTPQARWFWNSIPEDAQARIIGAVWCSHCGQKTTIINFKGNIQRGDLILRGECLRCGGVVVRLLEGS